uniref:Uncharacterized protein n=1 Tax=Lepeophtheirus salmonis TaxID=72036 RepID=A0A0K2UUY1_LEPSM
MNPLLSERYSQWVYLLIQECVCS